MRQNVGSVDIDINELITDFDSTGFGTTDVSCPICFGNGFVGGFSWTKIPDVEFDPRDVELYRIDGDPKSYPQYVDES